MKYGVTWGRVGYPAEQAKLDNESAAHAVFDALLAHGWDSVAMWEGTSIVRTGPALGPHLAQLASREGKGCTHPEDEPCFGKRRCFRCRKADCKGDCTPAPAPHPRLSVEREARRQAAAALDHHLPGSGPECDGREGLS